MASTPRTCIDVLPAAPRGKTRLALALGKRWPLQSQLRFRFLDGDPLLHERVMAVARQWIQDIDVYFGVVSEGSADIRISFQPGGSWSYVGTDAEEIDPALATMNFGWLDRDTPEDELAAVVLHEFGHALGCIHEHQHPAGGIRWNKDVVYEHYRRTQGWDAAKVDAQVFAVYEAALLVATPNADTDSIMMYPIPEGFANVVVGWNTGLSAKDKEFIRHVYALSQPA